MSSPPETRVVFESKTVSLASVHGVSTWAEYVESERTLVFHGVMTESERDKLLGVSADSAFQVATHRLFEDSRRFFRSEYVESERTLVFDGVMTESERDKLLGVSADSAFQVATHRLFEDSRRFF